MTRCSQWIRLLAGVGVDDSRLAVEERRRPRRLRTLAFLSSAPTPSVSRATIASFQAIVLAKSSFGGPIERPSAFSACGSLKRVRRVGRVDQRLRGNAADVEAGSSQPVGFDKDRVEAELAGADRRDIAARAAADDQDLAAKLVIHSQRVASMKSVAGVLDQRRARAG